MNFVKREILRKQGTKEKRKREGCKYKKMYKKKREIREVRGLKMVWFFPIVDRLMFYIF